MPERDRTARHRGYCSLGWTKRHREKTRLKEVTEPVLQGGTERIMTTGEDDESCISERDGLKSEIT